MRRCRTVSGSRPRNTSPGTDLARPFESGNIRVFIPITSMIVLSLVLTVLVNLFRR